MSSKNSTKLFEYVPSQTHQNQLPSQIFAKNIPLTTDLDKACAFNKYFHSAYLPSKVLTMPPSNSVSSNLSSITISLHDTFTALIQLDPKKSKGIDGIGPLVLKCCATPLCTPLNHLFVSSLQFSTIPSEWKVHRISPVLERLIFNQLSDFMSDSFSPSQFSFLPGRSTLQNLLIFLSDLNNNLNSRELTDAIYLDSKKAFDIVRHVLIFYCKNFGMWVLAVICSCGLRNTLVLDNNVWQLMVHYLIYLRLHQEFHKEVFWDHYSF